MSEATLVHQLPTSTYRYNYRGGQLNLPPIKYFQPKSIVHKHARQQPPRYFPIEPLAPHRIIQKDPEGPVLGLGTKDINTEQFLEPKEITDTVPPQDFSIVRIPNEADQSKTKQLDVSDRTRKFFAKYGMNPEMVARLTQKHRWTSTTKHHNGEACLSIIPVPVPSSTIEENADIVRLKGQRYETKPEEWQSGVLWDKIQLRGAVQHQDLEKRSIGVPEELLIKRLKERRTHACLNRIRINSPKLRKHIAEENINSIYVRQCPGYAGFVPRQPPKVEMDKHKETPQMTSLMKASYRELPTKEYNPQIFARKGPMSRTVTLTYPFNPFNKITNEPVYLP